MIEISFISKLINSEAINLFKLKDSTVMHFEILYIIEILNKNLNNIKILYFYYFIFIIIEFIFSLYFLFLQNKIMLICKNYFMYP